MTKKNYFGIAIRCFLSYMRMINVRLWIMIISFFVLYLFLHRLFLKLLPYSGDKNPRVQKEFVANLFCIFTVIVVSILYLLIMKKYDKILPFESQPKILTVSNDNEQNQDFKPEHKNQEGCPNSENNEFKKNKDQMEEKNGDGWSNSENYDSKEEVFSEKKDQNSENYDSNGYSELVWKYLTKIAKIVLILAGVNPFKLGGQSSDTNPNFINQIHSRRREELADFERIVNSQQKEIDDHIEFLRRNFLPIDPDSEFTINSIQKKINDSRWYIKKMKMKIIFGESIQSLRKMKKSLSIPLLFLAPVAIYYIIIS